jgi:hypothetical protein
MDNITRRSFVSQAAAGVTSLGLLSAAAHATPAEEAHLVWKNSDWKLSEFLALVKDQARIKQVFDSTQIAEGRFLNNIKNSLNGLHFGFDIPDRQVKIVAALHGPANMLNYDDYIWDKYQIGDWLSVTDPSTTKPATRNIFYNSTRPSGEDAASKDPDNPDSLYQDTSVQTLQSRGVQFLSCHTATEEQARVLVRRNKLSQSSEEVVKDMLAHLQPGVLVVAAMVAAIALLQIEGHYSYVSV